MTSTRKFRRKTNWRKDGKSPDYRFTLANERTYLAWIRTAVTLLAVAIGIDQLTPDLAEPTIRILISVCLCLSAGLLSIFAYIRWSHNEQSIRKNQELKYTGFLKLVSAILFLLVLAITLVIIL